MGIDDSGYQSAPYVALYTVGAFSVFCSCFVVYSILRNSPLTLTLTRLVLYLHITLIVEDIVSMPYAYIGNTPLCQAMGFFRYYSSLCLVSVVGCMVIMYRNIIFEDSLPMLKHIVDKWSEVFCFILPIIPPIIPFTTGSFSVSDSTWCVIDAGIIGNLVSFFALYLWAWIILLLAIICILRTIYQVYRVDKEMSHKLLSSVGLYVIVTILAWIPRTEGRMRRTIHHTSYTGFYDETFVLYGSGIFYCLIFLTEKNGISRFESFSLNNQFRFSEEAKSSGNDERPSSIFKNPFYRGSNVSDKHKSTDSKGSDLVVKFVENPVSGDRTRSQHNSSGKVIFEGLDEQYNNL